MLSILLASVVPANAKTALLVIDTQKCFTNQLCEARAPSGARRLLFGNSNENASAGIGEGCTNPFAVCNPSVTGGTDSCLRTGSLGVATGMTIVPKLNQLRQEKSCLFDLVVRSQDFHPEGHVSFASTHFGPNWFEQVTVGQAVNLQCINATSGKITDSSCCLVDTTQEACDTLSCTADTNPNNPACLLCVEDPESCFEMPQAMWPDHCLQGPNGDADFVEELYVEPTDIVVQKGTDQYIDAYSVFMDNAKTHKTVVDDILKTEGIDTIFLGGIATDFCVYWSAIDAINLGYKVHLLLDGSAPIAIPVGEGATTETLALADMEASGVVMTTVDEVLAQPCTPQRRLLHPELQGKTIKLS